MRRAPIVVAVVLVFANVVANAERVHAAAVVSPVTLSSAPAHAGASYGANLTFISGAIWSVVSGALPPGLALTSTNGHIGGTPTDVGAYSFVVQAQAGASIATKAYTIFVRPPTSTGFDTRVDTTINSFYTSPYPLLTGCNDHRGYLNYGTAALWLDQSVSDANSKLAAVQLSHVIGQNCDPSIDASRANLWLSYLVRPYYLFNATSAYLPGRLSTAAASNLVTQMWAYAGTYSKLAEASDPWSIYDSENHDAQAESFDLLAAQAFKNRTDYATHVYADGSTPAQQYQAWRTHWSNYFDERAKHGLFIEVGSPVYSGYTLQAILNIYNFAEDPVLRKKAGMVLDLWFADVAQTSLKNTPGGAKSRSDSTASYDGNLDKMFDFANLLYGPVTPARNNAMLMLATSGYSPPAVVRSLAVSAGRGSFEYVSRRPGVGTSGWNQNKDWEVDPTRSVVDDTYVTPDYVLGTAELNPADTRIAPSRQNRWQGVVFASSPADRVYPQLGLSGSDTQDAFVSVQSRNVLIVRRNGGSTLPTLVYFPQSLESLNEQSGWLFAKAGGAYLAVRPANGTYSWLDPAKNKAANIANRFISLSDGSSPIIFETARTVAYASLQAFELDIMNNARTYTNGILNYTGSDGTTFVMGGPSGTPKVNNVPITYAPTKLFNSPYMQSTFGSGIVTITFGAQHATYNFSNATSPTKTLS